MPDKDHGPSFEEVWKSLEEQDTTGAYKQAREMADLAVEQLEYAYNSGYKVAKAEYERPQCNQITWEQGYKAGLAQGKQDTLNNITEHIQKMKSYYANGTMCSISESIIGENVCDDILKYFKGGAE